MKRLLPIIVVLVACHSILIGVLLITHGAGLFDYFGWKPAGNRFFFHQVGVFHVVLAVIYVGEYFRYRRVNSIILAKFAALVFLMIEYIWLTPQTPILLAGLGDGAIGAVVALSWVLSRK